MTLEVEHSERPWLKRLGVSVFLTGCVITCSWVYYSQGSAGRVVAESRRRVFIDSETGKVFEHLLVVGEDVPVKSPFTGKSTGIQAEACFWTSAGGVKAEPTYVLLNEMIGRQGPTFCPDCGRLVVMHNPPARAGTKAPPQQDQSAVRTAGMKE